jgi:hypothetical protein
MICAIYWKFPTSVPVSHPAGGHGQVLGMVYRVIATHLVRKAGLTKRIARTGAVTLAHRVGRFLERQGLRWPRRHELGTTAEAGVQRLRRGGAPPHLPGSFIRACLADQRGDQSNRRQRRDK